MEKEPESCEEKKRALEQKQAEIAAKKKAAKKSAKKKAKKKADSRPPPENEKGLGTRGDLG